MPHSLRLRKKIEKKFHYRAPGLRKIFEKKNSSHYRRSLDLEKKMIFFIHYAPVPGIPKT